MKKKTRYLYVSDVDVDNLKRSRYEMYWENEAVYFTSL